MEAAGLNPMLAYSQGGAGTPTGATASGGTPSAAQASGGMASSSAASGQRTQYNDAVASAINSGATAARMSQDLQRGQLENGQIEADAQGSYWKKNISPYLPDFGSAVSSAGGAAALLGL